MSDHTIVIIWVMKIFFLHFFCVFLPPLPNIFCFCYVHNISVLYGAHLCMKYSLGNSNFLEEISSLSFFCFPLFLCTDHWGRLSDLSLFFFGTLHSNGCIFPFLLCFSLLFFSQLSVRPQTAMLTFCISFSWGWSWSLTFSCGWSLIQCHKPPSIVHYI